jgi:hypothetical protein
MLALFGHFQQRNTVHAYAILPSKFPKPIPFFRLCCWRRTQLPWSQSGQIHARSLPTGSATAAQATICVLEATPWHVIEKTPPPPPLQATPQHPPPRASQQ